MKACVVSFADGVGQYQKRMQRLEQSLKGNFNGDFLGFTSYKDIGCEPHSEVPYKFKPYAIQKAIDYGYDIVIWCDSVVYAKKPMHDFIQYLLIEGNAFFDNIGYSIGDYTNDKALDHFGIHRDYAFSIPMIMACCMGFNFTGVGKEENLSLFTDYLLLSDNLYPGEWNNDDLTESEDMRCKGHRHDQSVMSALLHTHGITILKGQETFFAYEEHRRVMPIADSVCLFSEG